MVPLEGIDERKSAAIRTEAAWTSCSLHWEANESPRASSHLPFVPGSSLAIETKGFPSGSEVFPSRDRFAESITLVMPFAANTREMRRTSCGRFLAMLGTDRQVVRFAAFYQDPRGESATGLLSHAGYLLNRFDRNISITNFKRRANRR